MALFLVLPPSSKHQTLADRILLMVIENPNALFEFSDATAGEAVLVMQIFSTRATYCTMRRSLTRTKYLPKTGATHILLLHNGQPRTHVYAQHHLSGLLKNNLNTPFAVNKHFINLFMGNRLKEYLRNSENKEYLTDFLLPFSRKLETSLSSVLPEFSPFKCSFSYLCDETSIPSAVHNVLRCDSGVDNLLMILLYPFYNRLLAKPLVDSVLPLLNDKQHSLSDEKWYDFISDKDFTSFSYTFLVNVGLNECFIQFWAERLSRIMSENQEIEAIVFATPLAFFNNKEHSSNVSDSARRVNYEMHKHLTRSVPYRVAFYSAWNDMSPAIPLQTIKRQISDLRSKGCQKSILVVPFGHLVDDFDTQTILPRDLQDMENVVLFKLNVDDREYVIASLSNTFVEIIKHKLHNKKKN